MSTNVKHKQINSYALHFNKFQSELPLAHLKSPDIVQRSQHFRNKSNKLMECKSIGVLANSNNENVDSPILLSKINLNFEDFSQKQQQLHLKTQNFKKLFGGSITRRLGSQVNSFESLQQNNAQRRLDSQQIMQSNSYGIQNTVEEARTIEEAKETIRSIMQRAPCRQQQKQRGNIKRQNYCKSLNKNINIAEKEAEQQLQSEERIQDTNHHLRSSSEEDKRIKKDLKIPSNSNIISNRCFLQQTKDQNIYQQQQNPNSQLCLINSESLRIFFNQNNFKSQKENEMLLKEEEKSPILPTYLKIKETYKNYKEQTQESSPKNFIQQGMRSTLDNTFLFSKAQQSTLETKEEIRYLSQEKKEKEKNKQHIQKMSKIDQLLASFNYQNSLQLPFVGEKVIGSKKFNRSSVSPYNKQKIMKLVKPSNNEFINIQPNQNKMFQLDSNDYLKSQKIKLTMPLPIKEFNSSNAYFPAHKKFSQFCQEERSISHCSKSTQIKQVDFRGSSRNSCRDDILPWENTYNQELEVYEENNMNTKLKELDNQNKIEQPYLAFHF